MKTVFNFDDSKDDDITQDRGTIKKTEGQGHPKVLLWHSWNPSQGEALVVISRLVE